jgi:hypothetical protein
MADNAKIRTLFGALVMGGSVVLQGCAGKDPSLAADGVPETEKSATDPVAKPADDKAVADEKSKIAVDPNYCQVELVFHEYTREGEDRPQKTCLDGQSKEDIMKRIEEAQAKACMSPFCGCWLG